MADKYKIFEALAKENKEDKDYRICLKMIDPSFLILAPHGGKIEPTTSEITREIAGDKFSHYCFEGIKLSKNSELHITSTNFDEPQCMELVRRCKTIITIHGKAGTGENIYMGGNDTALGNKIRYALNEAGFSAMDETNRYLMARNSQNICNRGQTGCGVQLEIHKGLRNKLKEDATLMTKFCSSIQAALIKSLS